MDKSKVAPSLLVGMGATDLANPDYQLGNGCLVDQLVGQFLSHVCGLGYLVEPKNVRTTLGSILKYNRRDPLSDHFNCLRTFALGGEAALLMASYPDGRPANPFPYFTEVMTGFEYTAAIGMLYEGQIENGLQCIGDIRARYDGLKRSPYDEAECGHHYGRAMISWAAGLALTGFRYSAVDGTIAFAAKEGRHFWSNGSAFGTVELKKADGKLAAVLSVLKGELALRKFVLTNAGEAVFGEPRKVLPGRPLTVEVGAVKPAVR
jgi:hypothetical protein